MDTIEKGLNPVVIALTGYKGCGKSTLATHILQSMRGVKRQSFADPLRHMLEAMGVGDYYHTMNKTAGIPFIPGNPTARQLLQTLGTEWGRNCIHPDIWAYTAERQFREVLKQGFSVVVDDMRFPNEYDVIRRLNGVVIRITRSEQIVQDDPHASEAYWSTFDYDFELVNDARPVDLFNSFTAGLKQHTTL